MNTWPTKSGNNGDVLWVNKDGKLEWRKPRMRTPDHNYRVTMKQADDTLRFYDTVDNCMAVGAAILFGSILSAAVYYLF